MHASSLSNQPIRLNYRRLYILPTRRGLGFVMLIALLFVIAFIYNNNLVYLLCFLLASLFFITILHTVNSLEGLLISKGNHKNAFAGDFAEHKIIIENPTKTPRYNVQLGFKNATVQSLDVAANNSQRVSLMQQTSQRGWITTNDLIVSSYFPLGLFRTWRRLDIEFKTLVYPKPLMHISPLPTTHISHGTQSQAPQGQDDFYGLQGYQAGDSIRHIHWRAFAKGQGLFIRQYSSTQSPDIWLDYEQTTGAGQEERLSQMCRWILEADKTGVSYGFRLAGLIISPNQGKAHSTQCLEALALA